MKKWMLALLVVSLCGISMAGELPDSSPAPQQQGKDFLLSLAIPGFSQIKAGRTHGYVMLAAEATIWTSMMLFNSEASLLREEAFDYALKYAHLNPSEYDSDVLQNLGKFNSSGFDADGYNASIRKQAIKLYPDDPVAQQDYIDEHAYGEDKYWNWDSAYRRSRYNQKRNTASDLEAYAKLTVGVLILNHLVSGLDVLIFNNQEHRTQLSLGMKGDTPVLNASVRF